MQLWKNLDFVHVGEHFDIDGRAIGLMPLLRDIIAKDSGHLSEFYEEGMAKQDSDKDDDEIVAVDKKYVDYMTQRGGRLIYKFLNGSGDNHIFLWKDGVVDLQISGTYVQVRGMSHNEDFIKEMQEYFESQWATPEATGHIYAIMRHGMHLQLSSLGNAGIPLIEENYTPKVIEDYKFVIKDLKAQDPSGRIAIMRGAPGTGKTHLIRDMLLAVPDAMHVLVNPDMVTNLAGPELLPLLLSHRHTAGPINLILEDADKCLVARDKENMNSIQSLLNLGDGILGSMLDLRIVATTNAKEIHFEEAITRPGRLSKMIEVGPLDYDTASKAFTRLCPKIKLAEQMNIKAELRKANSSFKMTLAEVYALARKNGWEAKVRKVESEDEDDYYD